MHHQHIKMEQMTEQMIKRLLTIMEEIKAEK
jgi:hypothetical protein